MKLTDCYYEKKDWRVCKKEVSQTRLFSCVRCVAALATEMLPNYKTIEELRKSFRSPLTYKL